MLGKAAGTDGLYRLGEVTPVFFAFWMPELRPFERNARDAEGFRPCELGRAEPGQNSFLVNLRNLRADRGSEGGDDPLNPLADAPVDGMPLKLDMPGRSQQLAVRTATYAAFVLCERWDRPERCEMALRLAAPAIRAELRFPADAWAEWQEVAAAAARLLGAWVTETAP